MRCDECNGNATRSAVNQKTGQVRVLCKRDSKTLPDSDTTRKLMKPLWVVRRLPLLVEKKAKRRG